MAKARNAFDENAPAPAPSETGSSVTIAPAQPQAQPKGANPFDETPAAAPGSTTAAPTTYDNTSWSGLAGDTAYRAANSGTLGALDYGLAGLHKIERATGYDPNATDLTTIQKQGDEWGANHPALALGADIAGYAVGPGKLKIGAKIAGKLGKGIAARMGGAAAENAGAAVIGDELHSQGQATTGDLLKTAVISGTTGALTGAIPGEKGPMAHTPSPTAGLKATEQAAYAPLRNVNYQAGDIGPAFDNAWAKAGSKVNLDNDFTTMADKISKEMAERYKTGKPITADEVAGYMRGLANNSPTKAEQAITKQLETALHGAVTSSRPLSSGGFRSGKEVSEKITEARAASLKENTSADIDRWIESGKRDTFGTQKEIAKKVDQSPSFYPGTAPILKEAAQPQSIASKIAEKAAHPLADAAITGGVGAAGDMLFGSHDPTTSALVGAAGALTGGVVGHAAGQKRTNDLVRQLARARHLNATGQNMPAKAFDEGIRVLGPIGAWARRASPGIGVSGRWMDYGKDD